MVYRLLVEAVNGVSIIASFIGPMELIELIHLNAETGEIVVSGKIDRERFSWINLTAKASDSGVPRRSTLAPVFIQVSYCSC